MATLAEANLSRADLYDANLTKADLGETNLSDAYLGLANLSGAHVGYNSDGSPRLVANEKLEEQARPSKVLPCPTARSTRTGSLARCLRNNYLMPALFSSMLDKEKAVKEENGHRR